MKWYLKVLRQYADFKGRSTRQEYWMFALFYCVFLLVLMALVAGFTAAMSFDEGQMSTVFMGFIYAYYFVFLLPTISLSVRRLHDINLSGWWCLVYLIPYISLIFSIAIGVIDTKPGDNQYGPNPKEPSSEEQDFIM